jgi:hypothetical protein
VLLLTVTGMVEILSQWLSKPSLVATERDKRHRRTDIHLFKTVFCSTLAPAISPAEGNPLAILACQPSITFCEVFMRITSQLICQAADQLKGFVGLNRKTGRYIVRFSEDAFGMDVADDGIIPASEFVWAPGHEQTMTLKRELIQLLLDQNIDDRINVTEPLRVYMQRQEVPEILAVRQSVQG